MSGRVGLIGMNVVESRSLGADRQPFHMEMVFLGGEGFKWDRGDRRVRDSGLDAHKTPALILRPDYVKMDVRTAP